MKRCYCFLGAALACQAALLSSCGGQQERIVLTSDGPRPSDEAIDRDPWALLPPGAVAWFQTDEHLFDSAFSARLERFFRERLPLAAGTGFDPQRDIELMVGGAYATLGSDFVAICQGRFDRAALENAQRAATKTRSEKELRSTEYAGAELYVSERLALSLLTSRTLVMGTQLGVRRVLEVVEERRMRRRLPPWFESLLDDRSAHFQVGIDLDAQPVPAVFHTDLEFMNHLRAGRIVGNFERPGLNFASSSTFSDPQAAEAAVQAAWDVKKKLEQNEVLLRTLDIRVPIRKLEGKHTGKDAQIVAEISGSDLVDLLAKGEQIFGQVDVGQWLVN